VGGPKSNHAALSLNGQKSEIRSSNFVKSEDSPRLCYHYHYHSEFRNFYAYAKVRKKAGSTSAQFRSTEDKPGSIFHLFLKNLDSRRDLASCLLLPADANNSERKNFHLQSCYSVLTGREQFWRKFRISKLTQTSQHNLQTCKWSIFDH